VTISTGTDRRPSGEVDGNVAEVGLGPDPRPVVERDERVPAVEPPGLQVPLDGRVAPGEPVLGDQPAVDLLGRVPLRARGRLIGRQGAVDHRLERAEHGGGPGRGRGQRVRERTGQDLEDGLRRVVQPGGDLADGQAVPVQLPKAGVLVHREHPSPRRAVKVPIVGRGSGVFLSCCSRFPSRC
jgi:hypothetical protein